MHRRQHAAARAATARMSPRCAVTLNALPSSACAAVAPRQTIDARLARARSRCRATGGTPAISLARGFLWIRRLPRGSHLKCFTTLVTYTLAVDARLRQRRSSSLPAGPTNGWPRGLRHRPAARRPASPRPCAALRRTPSAWRSSTDRSRGSPSPPRARFEGGARRDEISGAFRWTFGINVGPVTATWVAHRRTLVRPLPQRCPRPVLQRDRHISTQALYLCPLHRAAAQRHRQLVVCPLRSVSRSTRSQAGRGCHAGSADRGATRSRDTLPDRCRSRTRATRSPSRCSSGISPRSSIVRYEMQRVESSTPGATMRLRRARLDAQRAGAALIQRRRVHLQRQAADDLSEKDPRAELGIDHAGVLADPADAGVLRVDALLHRSGVDVGARVERLRRRARASTRPAHRAARR